MSQYFLSGFQAVLYHLLFLPYVMGSSGDDGWCIVPEIPLKSIVAYPLDPKTEDPLLESKYNPAIAPGDYLRVGTTILFGCPAGHTAADEESETLVNCKINPNNGQAEWDGAFPTCLPADINQIKDGEGTADVLTLWTLGVSLSTLVIVIFLLCGVGLLLWKHFCKRKETRADDQPTQLEQNNQQDLHNNARIKSKEVKIDLGSVSPELTNLIE